MGCTRARRKGRWATFSTIVQAVAHRWGGWATTSGSLRSCRPLARRLLLAAAEEAPMKKVVPLNLIMLVATATLASANANAESAHDTRDSIVTPFLSGERAGETGGSAASGDRDPSTARTLLRPAIEPLEGVP